jgi:hypothetical protein
MAAPDQTPPDQQTPPAASASPPQEQNPQPVQPADTQAPEQPVGAVEVQEPEKAELPPVTHNEPILTGGSAGAPVERLVRLLAAAGYASNTIVKGENPHAVLDNSVMADVHRFWNEKGVAEPQELFQGRDVDPTKEAGKWVGPHTWQALKDEAENLAAAA